MDAILLLLLVLGGPIVLAWLIIRHVVKKESEKPQRKQRNDLASGIGRDRALAEGARARASTDARQDQGPDLLTTALIINDDVPAEVRKHEPAPYEAPPSSPAKPRYEVDSSPSTTYDDSHSRSTSWDSGSSSSSSYDSGSSSSSSSSSWD